MRNIEFTYMDLQGRIIQVKNRLIDFWKYKIFKYALLIHLIYFLLSFILFIFTPEIDFQVYYKVGEIFFSDISDLYNSSNYVFPFRYFPLCAIFFIPFSFLPYEISFIVFNSFNLFLNIFTSLLIYSIVILVRGIDHEQDDKRIITYISLFLIGLPHASNYVLGQINVYVSVFILISLFIFLKYEEIKWQFIGSIILGISAIIKPITIFLIPFLIVIHFNFKETKVCFQFKKSLVRLVGVILPLSLNIIPFLIVPSLLTGFLETNFSGEEPIIVNFSFSITKLVTNFIQFYLPDIFNNSVQIIIFLIVVAMIGGLGIIIYIFRKNKTNYMIFGFILGIIIMFLVYFDSWDHHLLILTPLLIIALFNLPRNSDISRKFIKPSFLALNFFSLLFMGVWVLTREYFPFNFFNTIFLLLIFYGIGIYSLKNDTKTREN